MWYTGFLIKLVETIVQTIVNCRNPMNLTIEFGNCAKNYRFHVHGGPKLQLTIEYYSKLQNSTEF